MTERIKRHGALFLQLCGAFLFFASTVFGGRLPVTVYTSADGLGSGFVDSLYRDSRGFLWASTRDGLSRFDGSRFVNFRVGEKNSAPGIENMYEMNDGRYLISTTGGTYLYDPRLSGTPDPADPRLNAINISGWRGRFLQDRSGQVWIASGRIFRLVEHDGKAEFQTVDLNIPPRPNTTFSSFEIAEAADGSIWFVTTWGIVRRLPDERIVVYGFSKEIFGGAGAVSLLADNNGRIWVSIVNDLFVLKPEPTDNISGAVTIRSLEDARAAAVTPGEIVELPRVGGEIFRLTHPELIDKPTSKRLFQTINGDVWISALETLLQIRKGVLNIHTSSEGLPSVMGRMAEDDAGNLWIGGFAGLARLNHQGMTSFGIGEGASSQQFSAITAGTDGTLYFAGPDANISRFDGRRLQTIRPDIKPNSQNLWTSRPVFIDSRGDFWLLTNGALHRFSGVKAFSELAGRKPTRSYTSADGLRSEGMFQIFEDSSGNIWISTRGTSSELHGISRLKRGSERFDDLTNAAGFPSRVTASSFAEDRNGNIWIGLYEGGVVKFDGERFVRPFEADVLASFGIISDIHIDGLGRLWFSTSNKGLLRVDDPSRADSAIVSFTTANGLRSNNIRTITEDRFGRLYLGTASGVDRLTPESGLVKNYSVTDGLAADFVVDSYRDRDGNVWFATFSGISRLVPQADEQTPAPRVFIGGLRIAGTEQPISELGALEITRGELSYADNNLQIEFFGLDFRAGETLRYQYKLEGADTDWSQPTELRLVTFANLQPAEYRFLVRAVNSAGAVSERPAVVSFRILSPVWARWWFILISALLILGIVMLFYRYRTARLREINVALAEAKRAEENLRRSREERLAELEKVRSRIATDLHDDIGASLTQIAVLSEVARASSSSGAQTSASEPLARISSVSNELVEAMSDIVWSINPAKDHLSDLTQRMRRFASDLLSSKNIAFQFTEPEMGQETILDTNLRRELFLIFKESVNNIVKHSGAGRVSIRLDVSAGWIELSISDDGKGFKPNAGDSSGGNGIASIRRRAPALNGTVEIESTPGSGTHTFVRLPLGQTAAATRSGGDKTTVGT